MLQNQGQWVALDVIRVLNVSKYGFSTVNLSNLDTTGKTHAPSSLIPPIRYLSTLLMSPLFCFPH